MVRCVFLASALLIFACDRHAATPSTESVPAGDVVLQRVHVRSFQGDVMQLEATAPSLNLVSATSEMHAPDANVLVPKEGLTVTAVQLEGVINDGHLRGHEGVTLVKHDGVKANSPEVVYERNSGARGTASGDHGVEVLRESSTLKAQTFTMDVAEQHAVFTKPVTHLQGAP